VINGYTPASLASLLNLPGGAKAVRSALDHFVKVGMVTVDGYAITVTNFAKRQAVTKDSPEAHAARQQRYRDRKSDAKRDGSSDVSRDGGSDGSSDGQSPVTQPVTRKSPRDVEEEEEEEKEKEQKQLPPAVAENPAPAADPVRRLPTPSQQAARQAVSAAVESHHARAKTGVPFPWSAKARAAVARIATACGEDCERVARVMAAAEADPWFADKFTPDLIAGQVAKLLQRGGAAPPSRPQPECIRVDEHHAIGRLM
jgi:hypothetical protein